MVGAKRSGKSWAVESLAFFPTSLDSLENALLGRDEYWCGQWTLKVSVSLCLDPGTLLSQDKGELWSQMELLTPGGVPQLGPVSQDPYKR